MINYLKYGLFSFLIIFLFSCREPFDYNPPASDINTIVVEGVVTDAPGPYLIKLSQPVSFSSDNQVAVKKAEVYVMDEMNNRFDFKEKSGGLYYSDSALFRGQLGKSYTLFIKTIDGTKYKSSPCIIGPESKVDSVYDYINYDTYPYNLQIFADLSFGSSQRMSTKLEASISVQNILYEWHFIYAPRYIIIINADSTIITRVLVPGESIKIDSFLVTSTFYTTKALTFVPILKTNTNYAVGSKITKIPMGSLHETASLDTLNDSTSTFYGGNYILTISASTISNETYNYYYNLTTQISGNNTFFDPIPVDLVGNIKCTSDSTKAAFGLFQANSIANKYAFIRQSGSISPAQGIPPSVSDTTFYTIDTTGTPIKRKKHQITK
jgi:Domain of unknown function (DUF4249)